MEKVVVMDDSEAVAAECFVFRTPPRILIPKLVRAREGWKARANARKKKLKAASIRIRDLEVSRQAWKDRCLAAKADLESRLEQSQRELRDARAEVDRLLDAKKKLNSLR